MGAVTIHEGLEGDMQLRGLRGEGTKDGKRRNGRKYMFCRGLPCNPLRTSHDQETTKIVQSEKSPRVGGEGEFFLRTVKSAERKGG